MRKTGRQREYGRVSSRERGRVTLGMKVSRSESPIHRLSFMFWQPHDAFNYMIGGFK